MKAVEKPEDPKERTSQNLAFVDQVSEANVRMTIENIRKMSPVLRIMEVDGEIGIIGAMYDVATGAVAFLDK